VVLMLLAAAFAYVRPFEVFVFSYAVLGPAHYLTQISWLHDRKYFSTGKADPILLGLVAGVITVAVYVGHRYVSKEYANTILIGGAFLAAAAAAFSKRLSIKALIVIGAFLVAWSMTRSTFWTLVAAHLLTTLVHVFVFTGFFIAVGAVRTKSMSG